MHTEQEVKHIVQKNIHQIKVSEFVSDGGWPNIDDIEVAIFSQKVEEGCETINLQILYTVDRAGCCFIPGSEEHRRLSKRLTISNDCVEII
ncbi:MAG: hypothetical protein ABF273_08285 [Wenyingzhuangia sp.]|uniref:hypothetical protein n=1 Tax=Wenyingzhuangia sp. TaxID=1964193 RepID=UPI00321994A8